MQYHHHIYKCSLWLQAVSLLLLSACSSSDPDVPGEEPAQSNVPVAFKAVSKWDMDTSTRLTEDEKGHLSFDDKESIGIFAYYNQNGVVSTTPNFMNNQQATYSSSSWNYSPVKYWPTNDNDNLSFYAYYPYRGSDDKDTIQAISSLEGDSKNPLKIAYCCPKANIDLMASQKIENKKYSTDTDGDKVSFKFQHLLARVKFTFTYIGEGAYHPVIHVLKYTIPRYKATVTCYTGTEGPTTADAFPFSWSKVTEDEDTAEVVRFVSDVAGTVLVDKGQVIPEFTAYLLPCKFPYSATADNHVGSFVISLNNRLYTYTPQEAIEVKAGYSYTVNFQVTNDYGSTGNYFITSYSIWKDGGTINGILQ